MIRISDSRDKKIKSVSKNDKRSGGGPELWNSAMELQGPEVGIARNRPELAGVGLGVSAKS